MVDSSASIGKTNWGAASSSFLLIAALRMPRAGTVSRPVLVDAALFGRDQSGVTGDATNASPARALPLSPTISRFSGFSFVVALLSIVRILDFTF